MKISVFESSSPKPAAERREIELEYLSWDSAVIEAVNDKEIDKRHW
jgi:hypothetical protein